MPVLDSKKVQRLLKISDMSSSEVLWPNFILSPFICLCLLCLLGLHISLCKVYEGFCFIVLATMNISCTSPLQIPLLLVMFKFLTAVITKVTDLQHKRPRGQ
jgi:hypothetical protein